MITICLFSGLLFGNLKAHKIQNVSICTRFNNINTFHTCSPISGYSKIEDTQGHVNSYFEVRWDKISTSTVQQMVVNGHIWLLEHTHTHK